MLIVFGIIILLILLYIIYYNIIIGAKNSVNENFASIDTVLQNRYDLIPNLIEVVKGYSIHEKSLIEKITSMRSELLNQKGINQDKMKMENELTIGLKSLFAVSENYPNLKANKNFLNLQNQMVEIEDRLQAARRGYNSSVQEYWNKTQTLPYLWIAKTMKLPLFEMYKADELSKNNLVSFK